MLILATFRSNHRSNFWRPIYLLCIFLFSFDVFSDLLNLDQSSFPLERHAVETLVMIADVPNNAEDAHPVEAASLLPGLVQSQAIRNEAAYVRLTRIRNFRGRDPARIHGYRVALPRSSPPDSLELL
jgi:hypothetical protein